MDQIEEPVHLLKEFPWLYHDCFYSVWDGYLPFKEQQFRIKVFTPFYPDLKNICFQCSPEMKTCLMSQVDNLKNCKTFRGFIYSILHIVKTNLNAVSSSALWGPRVTKSIHALLCELEDVIKKENILEVKDDFKEVTVKYTDSDRTDNILKLSLPNNYPKGNITILEADLPSDVLSGLSKASSIEAMYNLFKENVESLLPFWKICKTLEEKAWIIEPINPQRRDVYRRILINGTLSLILYFNPLDVSSAPDVNFLGPMNAVMNAREIYLKNLKEHGWNELLDITENIVNLLGITELPVKCEFSHESISDENNCSICFTYIVDGEEPPAKWCSNPNCSSLYHHSCLRKWLETGVSSVCLYDHISGPCPYCHEKIWCPLNTDAK